MKIDKRIIITIILIVVVANALVAYGLINVINIANMEAGFDWEAHQILGVLFFDVFITIAEIFGIIASIKFPPKKKNENADEKIAARYGLVS